MKQITAPQFQAEILKDPAWAATLTEPIEIIGVCDMRASQITHLSPFLHFTTKDQSGHTAIFSDCLQLKRAEGHFAGYVHFYDAGIEEIGELKIDGTETTGKSATFGNCKALRIASGSFAGTVHFTNSGATQIGELTIKSPGQDGIKADFTGCNIRLPAEFLGSEYAMDKATRQKNLDRIAAAKAQKNQPEMEI